MHDYYPVGGGLKTQPRKYLKFLKNLEDIYLMEATLSLSRQSVMYLVQLIFKMSLDDYSVKYVHIYILYYIFDFQFKNIYFLFA